MIRNGLLVLSFAGALALGAPPVQASQESERAARFQSLDKNGDGKLDLSEYGGHPGNFRFLDKDGDGFVTLSEFQDRSVAQEQQPVAPPALAKPRNWPTPADDFTAKDHNKDGVVSREEWPDPPEFSRRDRNGDGVVNRDEYFADRKVDPREERFDRMDRNRDGVLSRSEWKGSSRTFERTDTNRDGVLTREEYLR